MYVDYPGHQSLMQIYGTFNRAMLRLVPSLRTYADPLTEAMVDFYLMSQVNFKWYNEKVTVIMPGFHFCYIFRNVSLKICNHTMCIVHVNLPAGSRGSMKL